MKERIIGLLAALAMLSSASAAFAAEPDSVQPDELRLEESEGEASLAGALTYGELTYEVEDGAVRITGCDKAATSIDIPAEIDGISVTSIGSEAFYLCKSLASISIPDSVKTISRSAFYGCTSLKTINMGNGITYIANEAFEDCDNLEGVYIHDLTAWCNTTFGYISPFICTNGNVDSSNPLYYAKNLYLNNELVTDLVIPNNITSIGDRVFLNCDSIQRITIPDSVTRIYKSAFNGCGNLTEIVLPNSITIIGDKAFDQCTSLKDVYYSGSIDEWNAIEIIWPNDPLLNAAIRCNGEIPPPPEITATADVSDAGIMISAELSNTYKNFTIVAAAYSNGNYTATDTFRAERGETLAELYIKDAAVDSVRIFLWDSLNGMMPMCDSIDISV